MKLRIVFSLIVILTLSACSTEAEKTLNDATKSVTDQVSNLRDKDEPHVLSVKNGYLEDYADKSIGEAFEKFFGEPTWKYFKSDTGKDVVEFTGFLVYQEAEVKARMQFLLNEDNTFEIGALAFNDVPQNQLTTNAVITSVFEDQQYQE